MIERGKSVSDEPNKKGIEKLQQLFTDNQNTIESLLEQFWCPHSNNHNLHYFYDRFFNLSDAELYKLTISAEISIEDIAKLIPFQEPETMLTSYHPIGLSRKLPLNCHAFA